MNHLIYQASVPVYQQILHALSGIIDKADAHAQSKQINPQVLLSARLYPDMFPFIKQVQVAADFAKAGAARLAGIEVPRFEDNETSFAELKARIDKTLTFVASVSADQLASSLEREVVTPVGKERTLTFANGADFLLRYNLPNFYFHATTAYDILRHNGVELGKRDFLGKVIG